MTATIVQKSRTPLVTVKLWSKSYAPLGRVRGVLTATMAPRWNAAGSASFVVISNDRSIPDLRTPGCRALIEYWADQDDATATLAISGTVKEEHGSPRTDRRTGITFTLEDDWADIMQHTLGWPAPSQPITNQGAEGAYYRVRGPAETVAKTIIEANCTRAGKPLIVPATAGLGATVTVKIRMHPLVDRLYPAIDNAGIGLQVLQVGSVRQLITHVQSIYAEVLTDVTGAVIEGNYTLKPPTVTRVICGAGGKKEARVFRRIIDSAREAAWGMKLERFLDVRDIDIDTPGIDPEAEIADRAQELLDEGRETSAIEAKLQESARTWVGQHIKLGTKVSVQLGDGPVVSDVVREIQVETTPAGVRVTPLVGPWDESGTSKTLRALAEANRRTRDLGVE